MTWICVGLSHREAPIAVRERVAVSLEQTGARLREIAALAGIREAMLLSTCNRLEIFAVADARGAGDDLLRMLGPLAEPHAVCRFEDDALRHLFRVAASLDSMVVGEAQILGQVKEAAALAQQAGTLGPELSRALARATAAARRVRTETEIARGAVSVSSVAVQLAHKLLGSLEGHSVLLLGAGEMAQLAARELHASGAELLVANRTGTASEALAAEVGGIAVGLGELPALLERADVVLCSTAAQQPLVTREVVGRGIKARRFRPLFLIDLALPRNVDPAVNELENVYVYDMDDLEGVGAQNRELRVGQVGRAEEIVDQELQAFQRQTLERKAVPVLARLRAHAESVARAEAERTLSALQGLDDRQQKALRAMALAIVNKLLHGPTSRLRAEAGAGPLGDAAAALFGLEGDLRAQPSEESAAGDGQGSASTEEGTVLPLLRRP